MFHDMTVTLVSLAIGLSIDVSPELPSQHFLLNTGKDSSIICINPDYPMIFKGAQIPRRIRFAR